MTEYSFFKYQGTGNDFVMIDNRDMSFDHEDQQLIADICDRRFGIGADGLILLENDEEYDFRMVYYNADGSESTMCGNGGRCIIRFAADLNIIHDQCRFIAIDGPHEGTIDGEMVKLKLNDVDRIEVIDGDYVLDTGSPHFIRVVNNVSALDVYDEGHRIRYSERFQSEGINVNFVQAKANSIQVATYERGVEDETYSCGTGVTAAAIAMHMYDPDEHTSPQIVETKGGDLKVYYTNRDQSFVDVYLEGPAVKVFEGTYFLK